MAGWQETLERIVMEKAPAYATAADIAHKVQGFVRAAVDYVIEFENWRREWLVGGNDGAMKRFYRLKKDKMFGLADAAYVVFEKLRSANKKAAAELFLHFSDNMVDYRYCVTALTTRFAMVWAEAKDVELHKKIDCMLKLEKALQHHYAAVIS